MEKLSIAVVDIRVINGRMMEDAGNLSTGIVENKKNWRLSTVDVDNIVENCAEVHIICSNREGMILVFNTQVSQEPVYTQDFTSTDG